MIRALKSLDSFKAEIEELYLQKSYTREEILNHLKETHDFSVGYKYFSTIYFISYMF
jgi:hypothetical protein